MQQHTKGIVIKVTRVNSSDIYCTYLTKDIGIVTVYIKNARKIKNNITATTDMFCYSDLVFFKHKDTYRLNEASPIELFFSLREDIEKTALAGYFCELILQTCSHGQQTIEVLKLLLMSLSHIIKGDLPPLQIKSIIELKLMSYIGYMPHLVACRECAVYDGEMYFNLHNGDIICSKCMSIKNGEIELSASILAAMRHIIYAEMQKLFKFTLDEPSIDYLSHLTQDYVFAHINKHFTTLEFYKSLSDFKV